VVFKQTLGKLDHKEEMQLIWSMCFC